MDIVYVIGGGKSSHGDIEMRMSLRSICKHGIGIGKVIVAGTPPDWLSKEVVQVCVSDCFGYKHNNILRCLENVVAKGLVKGDFLYSSDDHFYLRPVDFASYPVFRKDGDFKSKVAKDDPHFRYHKSLSDTRKLLMRHGLPHENYSQHCNTHFNAETFDIFHNLIEESYELPFGTEPTSLLMNCWQTMDNPPRVVDRTDAKLCRPYATAKEIKERLGDRHCFSIGDGIFEGRGIVEFFKEEFPDKCVFEM